MTDLSLTEQFDTPTRSDWMGLVEKALKGAPFDRTLVSQTLDQLKLEPLYARDNSVDVSGFGAPGSAPFVRGTSAQLNRLGWDIREPIAETDPAAAREVGLEALVGGASALVLPIAAAGQTGLPIDGLGTALDGVDLTIAGAVFAPGERFGETGAAFRAICSKRGGVAQVKGALNADPLGSLARTGGLDVALDQAMGQLIETLAAFDGFESFRVLSVDGRVAHEAGSSEAVEIAFAAASLVAYLRAAEAHGVDIDTVCSNTSVQLAANADMFGTIAKLRAARLVLWRVLDACGAGEAADKLCLDVSTSARMMTRYDAHVNMLRTTVASLAAGAGGADSVCTLPFSWALGKPNALARRMARNTHVILQEESAMAQVSDPAGGSWYVDRRSYELAEHCWSIFLEIENAGGLADALSGGLVQTLVRENAASAESQLRTGATDLVGVTAFPNLDEAAVDVEPHASSVIESDPAITVEPLSAQRLSAVFEQLRSKAESAGLSQNAPVAIVQIGSGALVSARTSFMRNQFATGGLRCNVLETDGAKCPEMDGAKVAALVGTDEDYASYGAELAQALAAHGLDYIIVAGRPGDLRGPLKDAGVNAFSHKGADRLELLETVHAHLGLG